MRARGLLLGLLLVALAAAPAWATPEPNNQPTHSEAELLGRLNQTAMPDGTISGYVHVQDPKAAVLIQPNGRLFEYFHAGAQRWIDGGMVVVAVLAVAPCCGSRRSSGSCTGSPRRRSCYWASLV
jgi:hypothetical protein